MFPEVKNAFLVLYDFKAGIVRAGHVKWAAEGYSCHVLLNLSLLTMVFFKGCVEVFALLGGERGDWHGVCDSWDDACGHERVSFADAQLWSYNPV